MPPRLVTNPMQASSGEDFFAISPSDTADFAYVVRGIYVGTAGNIVAITEGGTAVTFANVPVGTVLPIRARRVNNASTTASNLVGLY